MLFLADDPVPTVNVLGLLWQFANSPVGLMVVGWVLTSVFAYALKKSPAALKLYEANKGHFWDAVRAAEKAIPDDTSSSAGKKLDRALEYLLKLEAPISKRSKANLKKAIEMAHADGAAKKVE